MSNFVFLLTRRDDVPRSLTYVFRYGLSILLCRFMGPAEVATWGIVGFVWDTFEQLTGKKKAKAATLAVQDIADCR